MGGSFAIPTFGQNMICLGTVHKCDETHTPLMSADIDAYFSKHEMVKIA